MDNLFSLVLFGALVYVMMRYGCGAHMVHGHGKSEAGGHGQHAPAASRSIDPVCGMELAPNKGYTKMHEGREYRLCSRVCLDKFATHPQQYAA